MSKKGPNSNSFDHLSEPIIYLLMKKSPFIINTFKEKKTWKGNQNTKAFPKLTISGLYGTEQGMRPIFK